MKKLLIFLAFMQPAVLSYAQTSLRPGYIITTDTVRGTIVYHEGDQATQICSFKKDGASESGDYHPADIKGYGFESRHFVSVAYNGNPKFMEVIAAGQVRLLRSNRVYYLSKGTLWAALTAEKKQTIIEGRYYISEDKTWLVQAKQMLNDCNQLAHALDEVQISSLSSRDTERMFTKIVTQYNECHGDKTTVYKSGKSKGSVSFGLIAGITVPTARFTYSAVTDKSTGTAAPMFGVSLELTNPRISERWRFRTELSFTHISVSGTNPFDVYRSVKYSTVNIPLLVHYSFPTRSVVPFVRVGINSGFLINAKYEENAYRVSNTSLPGQMQTLSLKPVVMAGLETALGSKVHGYVEARYNFATTVNTQDLPRADEIRVTQLSFLTGIRF